MYAVKNQAGEVLSIHTLQVDADVAKVRMENNGRSQLAVSQGKEKDFVKLIRNKNQPNKGGL